MTELGYKTDGLQSRFELQKLLAAAVGRPEQHAVHFAVLRSLQRAIYSPKEEGHYALASQCYCHFTSPIRRYPDLTVHRLLDAILTKTKPRNDYDELVTLGRHTSDREQRAEAAERALTKLKLLAYLSDRIGEEMDAVVTGVESYGIFVQGIKLPAEGLVRVETLSDDYYRFDRATHTLAGHRAGNSYRLGDLLRVAVARVDLERRELDFRVVERKKGKAPISTKPTKSTKKGKKEQRRARQQNAATSLAVCALPASVLGATAGLSSSARCRYTGRHGPATWTSETSTSLSRSWPYPRTDFFLLPASALVDQRRMA